MFQYHDLRAVLAISKVNKHCEKEGRTSAIWLELKKIYKSDELEDLKKQIIIDLTNVCWPEGKKPLRIYSNTLNKYESLEDDTIGHGFFSEPKNLGVSQIAFIHACARSIYELDLWKEVQKRLKKTAIVGNIELVAPIDISSITRLTADERNSMINFPSIQNEFYKKVNDSAKIIDAWVNNNKNNFHLIKRFKFGPYFYDKRNLSALPSEFYNLTGLKRLTLQNFRFSSLSPEMAKLKDLELISLKLCSLAKFPEVFCKLTKLTSIDLTKNEVSSIAEEVALTKLEKLVLKSNPIKKECIPHNIKKIVLL